MAVDPIATGITTSLEGSTDTQPTPNSNRCRLGHLPMITANATPWMEVGPVGSGVSVNPVVVAAIEVVAAELVVDATDTAEASEVLSAAVEADSVVEASAELEVVLPTDAVAVMEASAVLAADVVAASVMVVACREVDTAAVDAPSVVVAEAAPVLVAARVV